MVAFNRHLCRQIYGGGVDNSFRFNISEKWEFAAFDRPSYLDKCIAHDIHLFNNKEDGIMQIRHVIPWLAILFALSFPLWLTPNSIPFRDFRKSLSVFRNVLIEQSKGQMLNQDYFKGG